MLTCCERGLRGQKTQGAVSPNFDYQKKRGGQISTKRFARCSFMENQTAILLRETPVLFCTFIVLDAIERVAVFDIPDEKVAVFIQKKEDVVIGFDEGEKTLWVVRV